MAERRVRAILIQSIDLVIPVASTAPGDPFVRDWRHVTEDHRNAEPRHHGTTVLSVRALRSGPTAPRTSGTRHGSKGPSGSPVPAVPSDERPVTR
ncbi:hypothetical protein GCM10010240_45410 [Streptomyces griseoviridis]|nr:hypothetical protein GCM10010240_45410 [Streptomyces griseoviridis]